MVECVVKFLLTLWSLPYILVGMLIRKSPKRRADRPRDPGLTPERLLQAALREVYRSGSQTASRETILGSTGVTEGAPYDHFESQEALECAVLDLQTSS
jgi:hypothetical protein